MQCRLCSWGPASLQPDVPARVRPACFPCLLTSGRGLLGPGSPTRGPALPTCLLKCCWAGLRGLRWVCALVLSLRCCARALSRCCFLCAAGGACRKAECGFDGLGPPTGPGHLGCGWRNIRHSPLTLLVTHTPPSAMTAAPNGGNAALGGRDAGACGRAAGGG